MAASSRLTGMHHRPREATVAEIQTIFTVRRIPRTAGAKNTVGYDSVEFEIIATSEADAIEKAVAQSTWRDPWSNFSWLVTGSRIFVLDAPTEGGER